VGEGDARVLLEPAALRRRLPAVSRCAARGRRDCVLLPVAVSGPILPRARARGLRALRRGAGGAGTRSRRAAGAHRAALREEALLYAGREDAWQAGVREPRQRPPAAGDYAA